MRLLGLIGRKNVKNNREETGARPPPMHNPIQFMMHRFFLLLLPFFFVPGLMAQDPFGTESSFTGPLDLKAKYHAYYRNGGASGFPPALELDLPEGFTAGELQFPIPHVIQSSEGTVSYGYEGRVTFMVQIEAGEELAAGSEHSFAGNFSWLECDVQCDPRDEDFAFKMTVGEETEFVESRLRMVR